MNSSDAETPLYGRQRLCPRCGARVAQKARTCFSCGAILDVDATPQRTLRVPWADVALLVVIGSLLIFWWQRAPTTPAGESSSLARLRATVGQLDVISPTPTPLPATPTPEPTATPTPTTTPTPTPILYKVVAGDTLELIAGRFGSTIGEIQAANGLAANSLLRIGQELLIPVSGSKGGPNPTATPTGGALVYAVQAGDSLSTVAMRFGSDVNWIIQANKLNPGDYLRVGQSLVIPLTPSTPTPTAMVLPTRAPTFTPRTGYPAPVPLTPSDGAIIASRDPVLLTWASVGVLDKDEWYVVSVISEGGKTNIPPYWTRETSWRLPPDYRGNGNAPVRFTWQVEVRSGTPDNPGQPLSPTSSARSFTWR